MLMSMDSRVATGLTLLVGTLLLPAVDAGPTLDAQERTVLSKEVAVGRAEAALGLEFRDGERLDIELRESSVFIDGEVVGAYSPGDALDEAFRALLGRAVALDDGPLTEMLVDWSPPTDLPEDRQLLAGRIDRSLETALTAEEAAEATAEDQGAPERIRVESGDEGRLIAALLSQANRLGLLDEALAQVDEVEIHVGEDVTVEAGRTVDGALLVVDADVRIAGTVTGDVIVVDGTLELLEGGSVEGDVRLADGEFVQAGGSFSGEVRRLTDDDRVTLGADDAPSDLRDRIRDELREEIRNEVRRSVDVDSGFDLGSGILAPFRGVFRAVGGILETLVGVLLMGLIGVGLVAFAPGNLDTVAQTARRSPGRAWMVGTAGAFLLLPVYVLGIVALAISIVGIPVLLAWVPLFPLAVVAAAILGYVAVARNVGEWLAESDFRFTDWIRPSNAVYTVFGGLLGLGAFFLASAALHIIPFSGFFRGLLSFAGVLATLGAGLVGFGSVLLTRAGRRPEVYPMDPEEAWRQAVDPDLESELDLGDDSSSHAGTGSAGGYRG